MIRRLTLLAMILVLAACSLPSPAPPDIDTSPAPTENAEQADRQSVGDLTERPLDDDQAGGSPTPAPDANTPAAPAQEVPLDDPARLLDSTPAPRDQIALAQAFGRVSPEDLTSCTQPVDAQVGDVETFWVSDTLNDTNYEVEAELRYAGPIVLMYVDRSADVDPADIERSARAFEERIYPRNRQIFGSERSPGVDCDPRLTILNVPLQGAGGYFSSADAVPAEVNRFSNEREMFVIGINSYPLGTDGYESTLAHEFQHMIEWNEQRRSPSWFNEGMSTLAEDLNGYVDHFTAMLALANPDIQLTAWSGDAAQTGEHYGTAQLFFRYIYEHYADDAGLAELIRNDAGNNVEAFVPLAQQRRPDIERFADIVADWAVANLLNDPSIDDGRYAYELLPATVEPEQVDLGEGAGDVSQFGADYLALPEGPLTLTFDGSDTVAVTGALPTEGAYAWWSNRGDDSVETLTRGFDLRDVDTATLELSMWHEIELNWDYAFVTVSTDGGDTWTTLEGRTSTTDDPQGHNYGYAFTGVSGAPGIEPDQGTRGVWIDESIDLTPYAGQEILLRFWVINDDALNSAGWMLDNIRIPEIGYTDGAETDAGGWEAEGFVRTTGLLPQEWSLRLVREGRDGTSVERVQTDAEGRAVITLNEGERGALMVMGSTPVTTERASYTYRIER